MRWRFHAAALILALAAFAGGCTTGGNDGEHEPPPADPHAGHTSGAAIAGLPLIAFRAASGATVRLAVEVADTAELRTCGLMHRTSLPPDQGMLFVLEEDSAGGFWMRNTIIPLQIAYIDEAGRIVDIIEMAPAGSGNTPYVTADGRQIAVPDGQQPPPGAQIQVYTPRAPYRYAVEANTGWFDRHNLAIGDPVDVSAAVQRGSQGQPPPLCQEKGT
jgi:uncharacterized membrane protein (UPF0127 family)